MKFRFRSSFFVAVVAVVGLFVFLGSSRRAEPAALQCKTVPVLLDRFLDVHYQYKTLDPDLERRTVQQFIKMLDPSKSLLLQAEVVELEKELLKTFKTMKAGECEALEEIPARMLKRAQANEAYAREVLTDKFKVDRSVSLTVDPDKRSYPATDEERKEITRKLIHFQMANLELTKVEPAEARKQLIHRYELATKRAQEVTYQSTLESFLEAFARALDPHSSYLSQAQLENFQISMRLSLEGIGATLSSKDGFTFIEGLIPGGGAEKSGKLQPQDKIVAVGQEGEAAVSVIDMELNDVVQMIRGKKGTKVTLSILRDTGEKPETFDVTIVRDKIDVKDQAASIRYETRKAGDREIKVGIIDLPSFYGGFGEQGRNAYVDVKNLLVEAKKEKVDGIVLDLSRNGGGLLQNAVKISGLFLRKGAVVATKDFRGNVEVLADEDPETVYTGPLVVLISRLSASASEILAGTLKAYDRALIVGSDQTFGKGTVQSVLDLPPGMGAIKVTTGMFFVANGKSTQQQGVASDVRLPSLFNEEEVGESKLDHHLPAQSIKQFLSADANAEKGAARWSPVQREVLQTLATTSQDRVAADDDFDDIRKRLSKKKNGDVIRISDLFEDKAEGEDDAPKSIKDLAKPLVDESVNILVDYVLAADGETMVVKSDKDGSEKTARP